MAKGRPKLAKSLKMSSKLVFNVDTGTYKRTREAAGVLAMQLSDYLRHAIEITNGAVLGPVTEAPGPRDRILAKLMHDLMGQMKP